jgi:hypothetical protein
MPQLVDPRGLRVISAVPVSELLLKGSYATKAEGRIMRESLPRTLHKLDHKALGRLSFLLCRCS